MDHARVQRLATRLDIQRHWRAAVRAARLDPHGLVRDHRDADHVPGAVGAPARLAAGHPIGCLARGERSGHPDLAGTRMHEHGLADLEPRQRLPGSVRADAEMRADLVDLGREAALEDTTIYVATKQLAVDRGRISEHAAQRIGATA